MRYKLAFMLCFGVSALVLSACLPQKPIILDPAEIPSSTPAELPTIVYEGQAESLLLAQTDLSKRLNIQIDTIEVIGVQAKKWSDGSLGCPKSGMVYAQVVTPGYQIVLKAANQFYEYHADAGRSVVPCIFPEASQTVPSQLSAYQIRIDATEGWQNADITLTLGDQLIIEVIDGRWTHQKGKASYNSGVGDQSYICAEYMSPNRCVEPLPSAPQGALIGKIGNIIFEIDEGTKITVQNAGDLFLRMNDGDIGLYDNDGMLTVKITVAK